MMTMTMIRLFLRVSFQSFLWLFIIILMMIIVIPIISGGSSYIH